MRHIGQYTIALPLSLPRTPTGLRRRPVEGAPSPRMISTAEKACTRTGWIMGWGVTHTSDATDPSQVGEWRYQHGQDGWLIADRITVVAGYSYYTSLEMVGNDWAPIVLATGSLVALTTLALLVWTVRRRCAATQAQDVEHVPLESDDCDEDGTVQDSTTEDDPEEHERERLTALV